MWFLMQDFLYNAIKIKRVIGKILIMENIQIWEIKMPQIGQIHLKQEVIHGGAYKLTITSKWDLTGTLASLGAEVKIMYILTCSGLISDTDHFNKQSDLWK